MTRALFAAFVLLAHAGASHGEGVKTDLYGDPLPPGAVARLGMIRGRNVQHFAEDLTFSADGKQLISCGCDGQVRVWNAATGELLRCQRLSWKPRKDEEQFEVVALSPGGAKVAACDRQRVYQYDTATGEELGRLPAGEGNDWLLTFSPNGELLVVQRYDKDAESAFRYSQLLWNLEGSRNHQPSTTLDGGLLNCSAFTPDGKRLAGMSGAGSIFLKVWDTARGKQIRENSNTFPGEPRDLYPRSLAFSPDGKTLAVAVSLHHLYLVDATTLKKKAIVKTPPDIKNCILSAPLFSADGRLLAALGRVNPEYSQVLLWDARSRITPRVLPGEVCENSKVAFAPDGKTLAAFGEWSHEVRLWDVASGRQRNRRPGHEKTVRALAVSPDGKMIASGGGRRLRLWDAVTSKPLLVLETADVETDKPQQVPKADEETISHCLFSTDGKRVISVSGTGVIQMWDVAARKELRRFAVKQRFGKVYAIGISADGKRLTATAEVDAEREGLMRLYVWDVDTGRLLTQRPYRVEVLTDADGFLNCLVDRTAFTPDGERISAWLGIEEVSTGYLVATLPKGLGRRMVFSPDGRFLAATLVQPNKSTYEEKGLCLIETVSGEEIFRLEIGEIEYVAFAPDGRAMVVADKENNLSVWDTFTCERLYPMARPDRWPGPGIAPSDFCSLAILPGGRAVTGMFEGDILVWDLAAATWPIRKPVRDLGRKELADLWSDLAGDARRAHRAIYKLADAPTQAAPFLKDHLPAVTMDAKRVEKLLADLGGDSFKAREAAARELTCLRYRVEPMLRRALEGKPLLEMRRRLEAILAGPKRPSAEDLRRLRAIAVLERIGTPEARQVLAKLAGGAEAPETREAKSALERLKRLSN